MLSAAGVHIDAARLAEAVVNSMRRCASFGAPEFDPSNRALAAKVLDLERKIRDQIEANRPRPTAAQLRQAGTRRRRTTALQLRQHRPADPISAGEPA